MKRTNLMRRLGRSDSSPRRWSRVLAIAVVLAVVCVSAAQAAKSGGILRIGGERDVSDLDPHTTRIGWDINIMQNVYSGLVRAGTDIQPRPDLATSWEFKTTTRLEFTLRQGVKFHNGREFTSADAKYSLERILDPNVPAGYASTIKSIASIETPSKYKLVLNLSRPDAAIVTNLSLPAMAMVAKETVKPMPVGLKDGMTGTGPYMFKEHIKGRRLVLVKNPDYYDKSVPLLDELHFIPLIDQTARTNALRAGQVDYIEPVPPKDVNALKRDKRINVAGGAEHQLRQHLAQRGQEALRRREGAAGGGLRHRPQGNGRKGLRRLCPAAVGTAADSAVLGRKRRQVLQPGPGEGQEAVGGGRLPRRGRRRHTDRHHFLPCAVRRGSPVPSSRRSASGSRSRRRTAPAPHATGARATSRCIRFVGGVRTSWTRTAP